jgi:4'-phosphopantetheinyl transferase
MPDKINGIMVYVFYTRLVQPLPKDTFRSLLQLLPSGIQTKIAKYRKWQDAHRSLLGKVLLINGLEHLALTHYSLGNLKFTQFDKPFFDDVVDFNIAHSGEYILCAISLTNKVGIDVEEIQNIPLYDFERNFTATEWETITQAADYIPFFTFWTKKEAFLKAIGMGLNVPLNAISVFNNKVMWNGKEWFLHEIKLDKNHIAHLAMDNALPLIMLQKISYFN